MNIPAEQNNIETIQSSLLKPFDNILHRFSVRAGSIERGKNLYYYLQKISNTGIAENIMECRIIIAQSFLAVNLFIFQIKQSRKTNSQSPTTSMKIKLKY